MVEIPNTEHANILLKDYTGIVREFKAVSLHSYEHSMSDRKYKDYAELIKGIAMVEMKQLKLFGEMIKLLGVEPVYIDNAFPIGKPWSSSYVNYITQLREMIERLNSIELKAIEIYKYHITLILDTHVKKLLEMINIDEKYHLKLSTQDYEKYKNF